MSSYLDETLSAGPEARFPSQREIKRKVKGALPNVSGKVLERFVQNPWRAGASPSPMWNETEWARFLGPGMERLRPAFEARGARVLGQEPLSTAQGGRGSVFVYDASVMPRLDVLKERARRNGNFIETGVAPRGRLVVVKVTSILTDTWRKTVFEPPSWLLREAQIQAYLTTAGCKTAEDGVRYCAGDVVPHLYWAGFFPEDNVQVVVMEGIDGKTLYRALAPAEREIARTVYDKVEHAVFTLWAFGIVHGDLHWNNVMVQRDGRIKIVDFGFALMADKLARFPTPDARTMRSPKYHKLVDTLSDDTMLHRGYNTYNPNTKSLKFLFRKTGASAREVSVPPPPVASPPPPPPPPETNPVSVAARLMLGAVRQAHSAVVGSLAELVPGFRVYVAWGNGAWEVVVTALPLGDVDATRAAFNAGRVLCVIRLSGTASSRVVTPQVTAFATPQAQASGNALAAAVVEHVRAATGEPWEFPAAVPQNPF
jgi:hypothetical protein